MNSDSSVIKLKKCFTSYLLLVCLLIKKKNPSVL